MVVPALGDCTPDLRPGLVAVCRLGGEVVCGGADAVARWAVSRLGVVAVLIIPAGSGLPGCPSPLGFIEGVWFLCV